jgi:hypothetical protein
MFSGYSILVFLCASLIVGCKSASDNRASFRPIPERPVRIHFSDVHTIWCKTNAAEYAKYVVRSTLARGEYILNGTETIVDREKARKRTIWAFYQGGSRSYDFAEHSFRTDELTLSMNDLMKVFGTPYFCDGPNDVAGHFLCQWRFIDTGVSPPRAYKVNVAALPQNPALGFVILSIGTVTRQ